MPKLPKMPKIKVVNHFIKKKELRFQDIAKLILQVSRLLFVSNFELSKHLSVFVPLWLNDYKKISLLSHIKRFDFNQLASSSIVGVGLRCLWHNVA